MIQSIRYVTAFVLFMGWHGARVLFAAVTGVRQKTGGVYDDAARQWGKGMLRWTGIGVRVEGSQRLDPGVPTVYVANHASFLDIWAILAEVPGTVRFVYKKGMDWIPLMGLAMRAARHIPINRHNRSAAFAAYDEAATVIRGGVSAVVFPEGTRSRDGRLMPFKKGPFVLAIAAKAPVVPVFCENTYELMPKGSWSPKRGTIVLRIGEPIPSAGLSYQQRDELAQAARAALLALGARE